MMGCRKMSDFETLLEKGKNFHGDICPGIVMGTRIAMAGMRELEMNVFEKNRDLIVYVEIDRCMTDAIQAVTGLTMGHRTLKFRDYGKFAATFVDLSTNKAIRISALESSRGDPSEVSMDEIVEKLSNIPEEELMKIEAVQVDIPEEDIPGFPKYKTFCEECGERILDRREIIVDDKTFCKACAEGQYYQKI